MDEQRHALVRTVSEQLNVRSTLYGRLGAPFFSHQRTCWNSVGVLSSGDAKYRLGKFRDADDQSQISRYIPQRIRNSDIGIMEGYDSRAWSMEWYHLQLRRRRRRYRVVSWDLCVTPEWPRRIGRLHKSVHGGRLLSQRMESDLATCSLADTWCISSPIPTSNKSTGNTNTNIKNKSSPKSTPLTAENRLARCVC